MKTKREKDEDKKTELERVHTLTNSYLMMDNDKINGVIDRYYNWTDYNKFSRPTEDIDMGSGMISGGGGTAAVPNPIINFTIQLSDGNSTNTALSWAATGEQDSGWIRNAANDYSYLVNGSSVTEWLAGAFRVNYMTSGSVLFAGANGLLTQNNASFFWDNPNKQLDIYGTTGAQLQFGDSASMSVSHRFYDDGGAADSTYIIDPASAITHDGAFCFFKMYASDFSFSYGSGVISGEGVPNVTISGPPNTGTYTSASGPGLNFYNELESLNNKLWSIYLNAKILTFEVNTDANNAPLPWLTVTRSGTSVTDVRFPKGMNVTNANALGWTDSGGTLRTVLQLYSDSNIYFDNSATGSFIVRGGPSAGNTNTLLTITNAGVLQMENAHALNWLDSGGTTRNVLLLYSDNHIYFDNSAGGSIFLRTSTTIERLGIDTSGNVVINDPQNDCDFRVEGDSISHLFFTDATATTENIAMLAAAAPNWQSMDRGLFIGNTSTAPTGNPASGHFYYDNAGTPTWRSSGGAIMNLSQATGGQNVTNNVTDTASTNGTIPDITNGTVYATDYTNLRNALFQLARMLKQDHDQLRAMGILT